VRYDEIVQMHSCELCRAKAATAGDLLAWHATHSAAVLERAASPKRVMVWQDMFDPFVNGNRTGAYKDIEGGITGAWKGLPQSWVVANWDHSNEGCAHMQASYCPLSSCGLYECWLRCEWVVTIDFMHSLQHASCVCLPWLLWGRKGSIVLRSV
jgi:hypothetical protein